MVIDEGQPNEAADHQLPWLGGTAGLCGSAGGGQQAGLPALKGSPRRFGAALQKPQRQLGARQIHGLALRHGRRHTNRSELQDATLSGRDRAY